MATMSSNDPDGRSPLSPTGLTVRKSTPRSGSSVSEMSYTSIPKRRARNSTPSTRSSRTSSVAPLVPRREGDKEREDRAFSSHHPLCEDLEEEDIGDDYDDFMRALVIEDAKLNADSWAATDLAPVKSDPIGSTREIPGAPEDWKAPGTTPGWKPANLKSSNPLSLPPFSSLSPSLPPSFPLSLSLPPYLSLRAPPTMLPPSGHNSCTGL